MEFGYRPTLHRSGSICVRGNRALGLLGLRVRATIRDCTVDMELDASRRVSNCFISFVLEISRCELCFNFGEGGMIIRRKSLF